MSTSKLIDIAKKVEALLQQALGLAAGTGIISDTFTASIAAARNNVLKRAYFVEDNKKDV